jgi:hypothetical protein
LDPREALPELLGELKNLQEADPQGGHAKAFASGHTHPGDSRHREYYGHDLLERGFQSMAVEQHRRAYIKFELPIRHLMLPTFGVILSQF